MNSQIVFAQLLKPEEQALLTRFDKHVVTNYYDGTESSNWPHLSDETYRGIAASIGFPETPEGLMDYCFEHEFFHSFLPMVMFGRASYVVWNSAHAKPGRLVAAQMEEKMVYYFQRYFHGRVAAIDDHWAAWKTQAQEMLGVVY
jgi:hypothetical protein